VGMALRMGGGGAIKPSTEISRLRWGEGGAIVGARAGIGAGGAAGTAKVALRVGSRGGATPSALLTVAARSREGRGGGACTSPPLWNDGVVGNAGEGLLLPRPLPSPGKGGDALGLGEERVDLRAGN
jgi:hypothetical protein